MQRLAGPLGKIAQLLGRRDDAREAAAYLVLEAVAVLRELAGRFAPHQLVVCRRHDLVYHEVEPVDRHQGAAERFGLVGEMLHAGPDEAVEDLGIGGQIAARLQPRAVHEGSALGDHAPVAPVDGVIEEKMPVFELTLLQLLGITPVDRLLDLPAAEERIEEAVDDRTDMRSDRRPGGSQIVMQPAAEGEAGYAVLHLQIGADLGQLIQNARALDDKIGFGVHELPLAIRRAGRRRASGPGSCCSRSPYAHARVNFR